MNRFIVAALAVVAIAISGGAAIHVANAEQVKSHPEITVEQTACDELTLTVVAYISHPDSPTGTYELVTGWLGDDLDPVTHVVPQGEETFTYTEVIDLPFDGDTFRAVLEISGISEDPFDEEDVEATDETCSSITVAKDVDPEDDSGQDFNFDGAFTFELEDDDSITFDGLEPGSYRIHEIVPEGFNLEDIDCGDADVSDADLDDADVNVVLGSDEDVECVVTNAPVPSATATPAPTSTPAPTQTPVVVQSPPQIIFVPAPTATPVRTTIRPPSTGDAGLVE